MAVKQVERTFGLVIRKISDFQHLDGRVQKEQLRQVLEVFPEMGRFMFEHLNSSVLLSEDAAVDEDFAKTNHERLTKCWPIFGGHIFQNQLFNQ